MSKQNKNNVRRLFEEVWNKGHVAVADDVNLWSILSITKHTLSIRPIDKILLIHHRLITFDVLD